MAMEGNDYGRTDDEAQQLPMWDAPDEAQPAHAGRLKGSNGCQEVEVGT